MNYLANLLTIASLVFGFVSIIFSLESHFTFASWAIIFSVIFDGLDGQIARKNPIPSEFGKELDSLVDVVSFGIAPSVLGYIFVYKHFYFWATLALFIYLLSSVIRLAKFNITSKEETVNYFYGLPTTASGGIVASFILLYRKYTNLPPPFIFLLLVLVLAYLMVSKIKYLNLDGLKQQLSQNKLLILGIILTLAIILIIFFLITAKFVPEIIILTLFLIYLLFSPFMVKSSHNS
jgi:CDP-diacylglycerol--serine O-phosphatidyltransferase